MFSFFLIALSTLSASLVSAGSSPDSVVLASQNANLKAHPNSRISKIAVGHNQIDSMVRAEAAVRFLAYKYSLTNSGFSFAAMSNVTTPLTNVQGFEYFGPMYAGSQQQQFQSLFDTGSSDTWLPSSSCTVCGAQPKFDPSKSSTFVNIGISASITYGSGYVSGTTGKDQFNVSGVNVQNQTFILVTNEDSSLSGAEFNNIVGMGFDGLATTKSPTLFSNMMTQGLVSASIFAFYMTKSGAGSELTLGGYDSSKFTGAINWIPVSRQLYWEIPIGKMTAGTYQFSLNSPKAIVDTGTSLIAVPSRIYSTLVSKIGATKLRTSGGGYIYAVKCNSSPPTVVFTLGGINYPLTGPEYMYNLNYNNWCMITFQSLSWSGTYDMFILGDAFLKKYYSIYNQGAARVGFATSI